MSTVRLQGNSFLAQTNSKLKEFLQARGVVCGRDTHGELAEKCFWAAKLDLPLKPTDREAEKEISNARNDKLNLDGGCVKLPWPQTLDSEWEDSPASLPDLDRFSIETFIKTVGRKLGLIKTEGRATLGLGKGLYLSGHVTDLQYHGISPNINYCFVRGKVKPQTKTSAPPYRPWVVVNKSNQQVVTADCTCIAGVQSGCKHIAALLFAVVEAVERGENRSCTSSKATWAIPSSRNLNSNKPVVAEDINVVKIKANADKQILHNPNTFYRSKFDPRSNANRHTQSLENFDLDRLAEISNRDCGILMYFKRPPLPTHQNPDINYISRVEDVVTSNPAETVTSALSHCVEFTTDFNQQLEDHLRITYRQQQQVVKDTKNQSQSKLWYNHRIGRITSSNVKLCSSSVVGNPPSHLGNNSHTAVATVMGYYGSPNSPSLHWGSCMEDVARKHYLAHHKLRNKHRRVSWQPTGLWVSIQSPFIAASPDGIISCQQCGKGLLEIKNPYKYRNSTIQEFTSKIDTCLIQCDGVTHLDRNHDYYYQVQFQLWVTGFHWCDFVLRTNSKVDNIFVERLVLDNNFISNILPKLHYFFYNGIIPELKSRSVQATVILNAVKKVMNGMLDTIDNQITSNTNIFYLCSVCGLECSENPKVEAMQSIACDVCDQWSHYSCVGLSGDEKFLRRRMSLWNCVNCKVSKKRKEAEP